MGARFFNGGNEKNLRALAYRKLRVRCLNNKQWMFEITKGTWVS